MYRLHTIAISGATVILPVAMAVYVVAQIVVGKTLWYGRRGDSGYIPPNGRIVERASDPGVFWLSIFWHVFLIFLMIYLWSRTPLP